MSQIMQQGIRELLNNGAIELVIFTLIFALVYGTLRKMNFLAGLSTTDAGDKAKRKEALKKVQPVHTILAMVMGVLSILPHHYAAWSSYDIIPVIMKSLPQVSFLLVGVLCALLLLGFFGMKLGGKKKNPLRGFVFLISVGFIVFIFGSNMNFWRNPWSSILTPDVVAVVIAVLVFAMVISFIMGETQTKHKDLAAFLADGDDKSKWKKAKMNHLLHDYMTEHEKDD